MPAINITATVDLAAEAAYIRFCDGEVARTVEVTDEVQIDLDAFAMALGIEILDLQAEIPFQRLITEYHVPIEAIDALRAIRPSVAGYFRIGQSGDGSLVTGGMRAPVPA
ncbi:Protein of unknown function [Jatrophihabitans endophyticus]|uniref:DUF2283 domain-containing protein n=1 Tax=Jatrophihabitans endophyticus TaxID=1206085 RepID=A0A1M5GXV0_9ACTN|nr:DUF2283 domain-containing protein [Jatrophihabitans endophyticus]SHG08556.1 Protein of unknown function [Jatrophihabitans endophyticus]